MVSQALMPKRCNVLLETVKELPPLQVLKKKVKDYAMTRRLADKTCGSRLASDGNGSVQPGRWVIHRLREQARSHWVLAACDIGVKADDQCKRLIWHFMLPTVRNLALCKLPTPSSSC